MNTDSIKSIYQEIATTINDLIPEKWSKVFLYVEGWEDFSTEYFYYYPEDGGAPLLSYNIADQFGLDNEEFEDRESELAELVLSLQDIFEEQGQEPWTNLTFILNSDGKFNVEYGYEDLREANMVEQRDSWKAKYGIETTN